MKKEIDILPYITRNVIASLIVEFLNKRKIKILIIETHKSKDKIELKNCDMEKVEKMRRLLYNKIKNKIKK